MALNLMHIDMDAFFAAVEQRDNPELKGKPVIIGGVGLSKRGVVSTASYEARKYGVHSAMPIVEARRLCPHGIYLAGRHDKYKEVSQQIFQIFSEYTPLVEKLSIDEAFLDLTGCHRLFGDSIQIGNKIKKDIYHKLGLTASVGLAENKFLAKLASGMDKPDGFFIFEPDRVAEILEPLSVNKIWGVGKKTEKILKNKGIDTIGRLKRLSINELESLLGKTGVNLYYLARGIDNRKVEIDNEIKSISHEETYQEDLTNKDSILDGLLRMSTKVSRRLRRKKLIGNTITIKVRYKDFSTYTRRLTLAIGTDDTNTIYHAGIRLLESNKLMKQPVRLLGIGLSNLSKKSCSQMSLFNDDIKENQLNKTIDILKDRFGDDSIIRARNLD